MSADTASEDQAIEHSTAVDGDDHRPQLPDDVRDALTKRAFSFGSLRKLLRDTYYMGPIGIGSGGWRGIYGGGQPGTQLRRPGGALYNFPRSWRYAALERALDTGVVTHVGNGRFAATERGVAVLHRIDVCPDCGEDREPYVESSYYVGDPNSDGHIENHRLVTRCPECGTDGYGGHGDSHGRSYKDFERDDDRVEAAVDAIADHPEARTFGGGRDVDRAAAERVPETDSDAITDLLDDVVENQAEPNPREVFSASDEGLYGREVVGVPANGEHYRFHGTEEAIAVSRTDDEGDIHVTLEGDGRLKVGMSYEIAVEYGAKDALHYDAEDAEWTGERSPTTNRWGGSNTTRTAR